MTTGRTLVKWLRMYVDGYDLSGYGRSVGPLSWSFDDVDMTAPMSDAAKGYLPSSIHISPGTYNGVLQSTTDSGVEISRIQSTGTSRDIMIPVGIRAAPAAGDPVFCCKSTHNGFQVVEDGGAMTVNGIFGEWDVSDLVTYPVPWGLLQEPYTTDTITTTGAALTYPGGIATAGGYMAYQIFAGGTGTWTIKITDCSSAGGSYADVEGLTVTVDASVPAAGIVQTTATTTAIDVYTKSVATEDVAGTLIFALALVRGIV